MFNLSFSRNGEKNCTSVYANFKLDLPIEKTIIPFEWPCHTHFAAELLKRHLQEEYDNKIADIRRRYYAMGFIAGKRAGKRAAKREMRKKKK